MTAVQPANLTLPGGNQIEVEGYAVNTFSGKPEQMVQVRNYISQKGFLPQELIEPEVNWFYTNLGIDDMYFQLESVDVISNHIMALYGAKMFAFIKNENKLDINLERETETGATFIHTSAPGVSQLNGKNYENLIDTKYLDKSTPEKSYRLETYRSQGTVSKSLTTQLRCYFVTKCSFVTSNPTAAEERDIRLVSDKTFLSKASPNTLEIYQRIIENVLSRTGPVLEVFDIQDSRQKRLVIGYRQGSSTGLFGALSDLYHYYELYSTRKYVEQFSNGVTIISLYLNPMPNSKAPPIEHSIFQVMKETSLIYCISTTPLHNFFQSHQLSVQETIYGYVCWLFASHFLNRLGSEYSVLSSILDQNNATHIEVLTKIKKRLRQDTFTREYVLEIIKQYPELIKLCYVNFAMVHYINPKENALRPSLSFQRIQANEVLTEEEMIARIKKTVSNNHELMVFEAFVQFNKHVLKTNFYQPTKVALSFRLDPVFLPELEYPTKLFGMFLVVGSEFRGFHLRFRDIARGGIRIIRSRNRESYSINLRNLFDENYGLAATQQRKNKDIPEGGSKGTILLEINHQDKAQVAFEKYVDAILDLLIVGETPGIKEKLVDRYGKTEILFFGPDEGTADYMDWASQHARKRGATFWKAFTTGKSQSLGGIPHDLFGMTTRSVHQYVLGILRKLGIKEENIHKLQTGGPDGDLGSNEIKISKDKTIGIVDGSGVLYDPDGLDRTELLNLANKRKMISNFDVSKLGPRGFRILIDEHSVKLPDGSVIENGLKFRNEFHLNPLSTAELFVPCGGRPEAVDIGNVNELLTSEGVPRFNYIVEGANLFFTQEARIKLEKAGAIIFKDASANKGGVTSSSLEVLAALAFTDDEFSANMQVKDGSVPAFYSEYIKNVHSIIEKNAELEFECLWREGERIRKPKSVLSDEISFAIIKLNEDLQKTALWDNVPLRRAILNEAFPRLLLEKLGMDKLLLRIPESYVRALFGSYLASRFVYKYGIEPSQFAFFEYMSPYYEKASLNSTTGGAKNAFKFRSLNDNINHSLNCIPSVVYLPATLNKSLIALPVNGSNRSLIPYQISIASKGTRQSPPSNPISKPNEPSIAFHKASSSSKPWINNLSALLNSKMKESKESNLRWIGEISPRILNMNYQKIMQSFTPLNLKLLLEGIFPKAFKLKRDLYERILKKTSRTLKHVNVMVNELTGYDQCLRQREEVKIMDENFRKDQENCQAMKLEYENLVIEHLRFQKEISSHLERKQSWNDADILKFAELHRGESLMDQKVKSARERLKTLEKHAEGSQIKYMEATRERYQVEQLWSEKMRTISSMGTIIVLVGQAIFMWLSQWWIEPMRRERMVNRIIEETKNYFSAQQIVKSNSHYGDTSSNQVSNEIDNEYHDRSNGNGSEREVFSGNAQDLPVSFIKDENDDVESDDKLEIAINSVTHDIGPIPVEDESQLSIDWPFEFKNIFLNLDYYKLALDHFISFSLEKVELYKGFLAGTFVTIIVRFLFGF